MTRIRERDAEYVEGRGAGYDRHEHPESECPADVDRCALLAAGDALAEVIRHPATPHQTGRQRGPCPLCAALTAWKKATG